MTDRVVHADAVIIGGGVAGLSAALSLAGDVVLVSKAKFGTGGSTPSAQGGIAVALADGDSPELHARDTLAVGAGINDHAAVDVLTNEGPARVRQLIMQGAQFDRDAAGRLQFGREAGHGRDRILHANGDATGAEIMRAMSAAVSQRDNVAVHDSTYAVDLLLDRGRVAGLVAIGPGGETIHYATSAVVLATGGIGRLYSHTTNSLEVTGDGLAMAARAGARLIDLEFVQFHPTALVSELDPMPLITEALRGAGAILVDQQGHRYMAAIHPDAELAPRDVVARANWELLEAGGAAYLDATQAVGDAFPERFPTVLAAARRAGLDPRTQPLPVSPAAHYFMGGVDVDGFGRTSISGLWAIGEVSATGAHGANRLASNSLLEGLVFGARAATSVGCSLLPPPALVAVPTVELVSAPSVIAELRSVMWQQVGLIRDAVGLASAVVRLEDLGRQLGDGSGEAANMALAARLVALAARDRTESRGAHYRSDHPEMKDATRRAYSQPTLVTVA